jgi:ribosomal protein L40E
MKQKLVAGLIVAMLGIMVFGVFVAASQPYAFEGAYAKYRATSSGYNYSTTSMTYTISNISGSQMDVKMESSDSYPSTHTDEIDSPHYFPAIPPSNLGGETIYISGMSYMKNGERDISVPAGTFSTYMYNLNYSSMTAQIYLDKSTGLVIKEHASDYSMDVTMELMETNIAKSGLSIPWMLIIIVIVLVVVIAVVVAVVMAVARRRGPSPYATSQYSPVQVQPATSPAYASTSALPHPDTLAAAPSAQSQGAGGKACPKCGALASPGSSYCPKCFSRIG